MSEEYFTKADIEALFDSKLDAAIEKMAANTSRQLDAHSDRIQETSTNWLDQLVEEADALEGGDDDDDYEDDDDDEEFDYSADDYEDNEPVRDPEVTALRRKLDALERQSQEDRSAREEAEYQQKRNSLRSSTIEAIQKTGKVVNPSQLLKLLESEGKIVERDGQYVVEGKDQFGVTYTSVADSIDGFLETDYGHFAPSRPGTGTGATAAGSNRTSATGLKYFNTDGTSKGNVGELMSKDPQGYMAELSQIQSR